ncbi:hypothetical protein MKY95_10185 [Paenibacillus sp. FSL P4-0176]|uniref:hypothetical protein n=1 Tax=Paenibacillus sp. FSL P4-0176 TaxID=2921631 RepID=UPI0030CBB39D
MKSKVKEAITPLTRSKLANPHSHTPMSERLANRESIDLRENHTVVDVDDGLVKIIPIDISKTHTYIGSEYTEQFINEVNSKPTEAAKERNKQAQALLHKLQR